MNAAFCPGRVLCALDVTAGPREPLAMASALAEYLGASLDGLHVVAPAIDWGNRVEKVRRLIAEHHVREQLESLMAPFSHSLKVASFVTRGTASEVIVSHATSHGSDLIVLGGSSERMERSAQAVVPSVAAQASCAVLTVPASTRACAVRRILLPISTTQDAGQATQWAATLAQRFQATVSVVRVHQNRRLWSTWLGGKSELPAEAVPSPGLLERVVATLSDARVRVEHAPGPFDVAQVAELARAERFDLAIVGLPAGSRGSLGTELAARLRSDRAVPALSVRARVAGAATQRARRLDAVDAFAELRFSA